jgi:hypothetical protein
VRNGTLHMACAPGDSECVTLSEVACVYDVLNQGAWRRALTLTDGYADVLSVDDTDDASMSQYSERRLTHLTSMGSRAPSNSATNGHANDGTLFTPTTNTVTSTSQYLISYRARLFCSLGDPEAGLEAWFPSQTDSAGNA